MCNINPKDIETWSVKSSSESGGGGTHPNNPGCPKYNPCPTKNTCSSDGPVEPDPNWGVGGLSLDRP